MWFQWMLRIIFLLHTATCLCNLQMCDTDYRYVTDSIFRHSVLSDILSCDKPCRINEFWLYVRVHHSAMFVPLLSRIIATRSGIHMITTTISISNVNDKSSTQWLSYVMSSLMFYCIVVKSAPMFSLTLVHILIRLIYYWTWPWMGFILSITSNHPVWNKRHVAQFPMEPLWWSSAAINQWDRIKTLQTREKVSFNYSE